MRCLPRLCLILTVLVSALGASAGPVSAAAPSSAPTNLSPDGVTVGANPALSWSPVSGAAKYRVQVSTVWDFSSTVYNQDTYNTRATPPTQLPFSLLYWRVAGMDALNALGPYATASFTKTLGTAPVPVTPTNGQVLSFPNQPVILSWEPVPGASSYNIKIDDSADMVGATTDNTKNTSYTLTEPQTFTLSDGVTPQTWWWTVQAVFTNTVSPWSTPQSYQISWQVQPELQSPPDLAAGVTDVVFSWDPVPGAQSYQIQVSPNGDFENNKTLDLSGIFSTRYSPTTTFANGSYYWRVRARATGSATNWGPWSDVFEFGRSWPTRPQIVSPLWGGSGDAPIISNLELSWTPAAASGAGWVDHASWYHVQISTDVNFSSGNVDCYTNNTVFTPYTAITGGGEPVSCSVPASLQPGTAYYWRVQAMDQNIQGLWDMTSNLDTQRFVYLPGIPDTSCGPANGATVSTPILCWSAVSGAEKYIVTVLRANNTQLMQVTTYGLTYTPTTRLNPADGPFKWHVESVDGAGRVGLQVAPKTFSLTDPTTDTSLTLLAPANGWSGVRMPSMSWQPYTGADHYKVRYGQTQGIWFAEPLSASAELPYAAFTYAPVPIASGHYYWAVEAYDVTDALLARSVAGNFDLGQNLATYGSWIVPWSNYSTPECQGVAQTDPSISRCVPVVGGTQLLSWVPDPYAGAYVVHVAKDVNFTTTYRKYKTLLPSLMPRESWLDSQAGESYYWFVQPCVDWNLTRCGPGPDTIFGQNNASAYRKQSAALTGLSTTTSDNPPVTATTIPNQITFNWGDYLSDTQAVTYPVAGVDSSRPTQEAKWYLFYAATAADFNSGSMLEGTSGIQVEQTQYTPALKTYPEGPIYWRVQAVDGSGQPLTMSATHQATKQSPAVTLTSPGSGALVTGLPFFTWIPENWAASYNIEIYKGTELTYTPADRVANGSSIKVAAWSPKNGLPGGEYYWRVQRLDVQGKPGPWSEGRRFTLQAEAPTLITPPNTSVIGISTGLDFTWTVVQNGFTYKIQTCLNADFTGTVQSTTTVMQEWAPTSAYAVGTYYWRVQVLDSTGNTISTSGTWSFTITAGTTDGSSTYRAISPARVLDSRPTGSGHTNMGLAGKFVAGTVRTFDVAGAYYVGGGTTIAVPATAVAVTGNLTVTGANAAGLIALGPTMTPTGDTTTLNFAMVSPTASENRANNVTMGLGAGGTLSAVFRSATAGATADLIFDVTGYFLPDTQGDTYHALAPGRVLDTRSGAGHIGLTGKFRSKIVRTINVSGVVGLGWPSALVPSNATAITGNITVTNATSDGFVSVGPTMTSTPQTSTVNVRRGRNIANGVTVALRTGRLQAVWCGTTGSTADLIVDITGYFTADTSGLRFFPIAPYRILDSVTGVGFTGPFAGNPAVPQTLNVGGTGGAGGVAADAAGIAGNLTVVAPSSNGFSLISPLIVLPVSSSTVNAYPTFDVANGFDVSLDGSGDVMLVWVGNVVGSTAHLQLDLNGYWK